MPGQTWLLGPAVDCNVTMPGFPDKFMPSMDEPPGGTFSSSVIGTYGRLIRTLRGITNTTLNKEPKWRHSRAQLTTGYHAPQS